MIRTQIQLSEAQARRIRVIARREGIDKAQVTRWLRLAFLSPTLVRKIRAGSHPTSMTIETLTRDLDLPILWKDQEALVVSLT